MTVSLRGTSAATLIAGILLLSRARGFGQRLQVEIVGDPSEISPVKGPAIVHSAVLASCGVGRTLGSGALVIVPGPSMSPLATSLSSDGLQGWFEVDRTGAGHHVATQQFVHLCRSRDAEHREQGRLLRRALAVLGCSTEPALFDLLFSAPVPPLMRLAIALRAGRAMSGGRGRSITGFLTDGPSALPDPLPREACASSVIASTFHSGAMNVMLERLHGDVRAPVEQWVSSMMANTGDFGDLVGELSWVFGHLSGLPPKSMLAPLSPSMDAVAVGIGSAIGATNGANDAMESLCEIFRFLGGKFTDYARYAIEVPGPAVPEGRLQRWQWLCQSATSSAQQADALWRKVVDPVQ